MQGIELKMALLTGVVGGVLLILAELIFMHKKVAQYRNHLKKLHRSGRVGRLLAEVGALSLVALVQPAAISLLTVMALGSFNPAFSSHAVKQLKGEPEAERPLRNDPHNY